MSKRSHFRLYEIMYIPKITIAILLTFICTFAHAQSCHDIFASPFGTPVRFSHFKDTMFFRAYTFKPYSGPGQWIVLYPRQFTASHFDRTVSEARMFFEKFGIHERGGKVVMPDAEKLNSFIDNGIQFLDIPRYLPQHYSNAYFNKNLARGIVPLATRPDYFEHDRLQEHLAGALMMPPWLFQKLIQRARFQEALVRSPATRPFVASLMKTGHMWDSITSNFGFRLGSLLATKPVHFSDISLMAFELVTADLFTATIFDQSTVENFVTKLPEKKRAAFLAKIQDIGKQFPFTRITKEFALNEAFKIIHEVTGESEARLRATYAKDLED